MTIGLTAARCSTCRRATSSRGMLLTSILLIALAGCQDAPEPIEDVVEEPPAVLPEIATPSEAIVVAEGELLTFEPQITNREDLATSPVFQLTNGQLPVGCQWDQATGALQWTPAETDGPGRYALEFSCHAGTDPAEVVTYQVDIQVDEVNAPPRLEMPTEVSIPAGATFEQPVGVIDDDFPANRVSLHLKSGPKGALVDEIGRILYWAIPEDWQEPRVEFRIAAEDDGVPPQTTTHTVVVLVTDIRPPKPVMQDTPKSSDRIPEVAVDLPALPRPGEPIEPVSLEFELDPPVPQEYARLSLMVPDDLRSLLKMRYVNDADHHLAIMLTTPFEADDVPGNLTDGIAATCELQGDSYIWTWAMTKDLTARSIQNNIRNGVLSVESKNGGTPRLVALQQAIDVPAPSVDTMLADEDMRASLARQERVNKIISLDGLECSADNGNWTVSLDPQIDGFSLFLTNPELTQRVNSGARAGGMQFETFGFRVLPLSTEITLGLDAKPSPAEASQKLRAARKALISKQGDARRWQTKLAAARGLLASAQRMSTKSPTDRAAKNTKINQATRAINQAEARLAQLAIEIPADENLVQTMTKEWEAIETQLQPVRRCRVSGELWRRIGDVRVLVMRIVPVELPPEEPATSQAGQ